MALKGVNTMYLKETIYNDIVHLLLYVDDMLITCKSNEDIKKVNVMLEREFEMKDI